MSGPYRAAMMLRLRCHEGLRGVGDADSYRRGGFHIRPWECAAAQAAREDESRTSIKIVIKDFEIYPTSTAASALAAYSPARRASSSVFACPPISIKTLPVVKS